MSFEDVNCICKMSPSLLIHSAQRRRNALTGFMVNCQAKYLLRKLEAREAQTTLFCTFHLENLTLWLASHALHCNFLEDFGALVYCCGYPNVLSNAFRPLTAWPASVVDDGIEREKRMINMLNRLKLQESGI